MPGYEPDPGVRPESGSGSRRAYRIPVWRKAWQGWTPDTGPPRTLAPRCGRVLALDGRYERAGWPGDPGNPPVCGRPEGHRPPCRSEAAVARALMADADRAASKAGGGGTVRPSVPRDTCGRCGEFLPHYCAAVVAVRRERSGRKTVTVTDRQPAEERSHAA
jgi:hypothetical protein